VFMARRRFGIHEKSHTSKRAALLTPSRPTRYTGAEASSMRSVSSRDRPARAVVVATGRISRAWPHPDRDAEVACENRAPIGRRQRRGGGRGTSH